MEKKNKDIKKYSAKFEEFCRIKDVIPTSFLESIDEPLAKKLDSIIIEDDRAEICKQLYDIFKEDITKFGEEGGKYFKT